MRARPLAALALLCAFPAYAQKARVELVPELGSPGSAPAASAAFFAAPPQLEPNALIPAINLGIPASAAAALALPTPVVPSPARAAAAQPVPGEGRALLIKSLAAPALDVSKLGSGDSAGAAEKDFNARAQLGAPIEAASAVSAPSFGSARAPLRSAKAPAVKALQPSGGAGALEPVVTPESLRAMAERGESGLLVRTPDGRWLLAPRAGAATAYPMPQELEAAAGHDGRFFVFSRAGLVEWHPIVPNQITVTLPAQLSRLASRIPGLYPAVLGLYDVAVRRTSWNQVVKQGLDAGEPPLNEMVIINRVIPALVTEEFPVVAAKLGRSVDANYRADVLARTNSYRMYWHSAITYKDHPDNLGVPDGHFRSDFGIRLMVKPDWRGLKDLAANYRPLFSHEYVHWLQDEGFISTKWGSEMAAVAVEVLRAIELVGLDEVLAGRAGTVHSGVMSAFDGGRDWARSGFKREAVPYLRGGLAGAAYEAAQVTGRPEAAWEFLNLVIAGQGALEPAAAWARVVGSK